MPTHRDDGRGITKDRAPSARKLTRRKYAEAKADRDVEAERATALAGMSRRERAEALAAERVAEQARALIEATGRGRRLLGVAEAASYVGVSRWTIARMLDAGELRFVMRRGRRMILPSDLDRIFREQAS